MIVEQVWTGNAYRNFNYLVACPETGDALAIDPQSGATEELLRLDEEDVQAVAVDGHVVYAATSPQGKVYRIAPGGEPSLHEGDLVALGDVDAQGELAHRPVPGALIHQGGHLDGLLSL